MIYKEVKCKSNKSKKYFGIKKNDKNNNENFNYINTIIHNFYQGQFSFSMIFFGLYINK